jgi:hypothetical protein
MPEETLASQLAHVGEEDLDAGIEDADGDGLADETRGHRVRAVLRSDSAPRADDEVDLDELREPLSAHRAHRVELFTEASAARRVGLRSTSWTKSCHASTSAKSRLPRSKSACSSLRFSAPLLDSTSPFCSFFPIAVVRGVMPKWRMSARYSALKGRFFRAVARRADAPTWSPTAAGRSVHPRAGHASDRCSLRRHAGLFGKGRVDSAS